VPWPWATQRALAHRAESNKKRVAFPWREVNEEQNLIQDAQDILYGWKMLKNMAVRFHMATWVRFHQRNPRKIKTYCFNKKCRDWTDND
jgi:hypothetical protein